MSGNVYENLEKYPLLKQFQATWSSDLISDVARALINIPMGKVDQLSWSTRQYWSHLNERVERELSCQFHTFIQLLIQEISWSSRLIKKIASVTGALDAHLRSSKWV